MFMSGPQFLKHSVLALIFSCMHYTRVIEYGQATSGVTLHQHVIWPSVFPCYTRVYLLLAKSGPRLGQRWADFELTCYLAIRRPMLQWCLPAVCQNWAALMLTNTGPTLGQHWANIEMTCHLAIGRPILHWGLPAVGQKWTSLMLSQH